MKNNISSKFLSYLILSALVVAATGLSFEYAQTVSAQKRSLLSEKNDDQPGQVLEIRTSAPEANVAGTLTDADPVFNRPVSCAALSGVGTAVHYDVIPFTVSAPGTVTLSFEPGDGGSISPQGTGTAGPDTFMVLYTGAFNPAAPLTNCTSVNDDISGATNRRSRISQALGAGSYNVVVTSFNNAPTTVADDNALPWTYSLAVIGGVTTAAGVTVGGRVMTAEGRGLRGARVTMTDSNGAARSVFTGAMGRFQFDDVEPGQTYVITIGSRRFTFSPQVVQVTDNIGDLSFIAGQ